MKSFSVTVCLSAFLVGVGCSGGGVARSVLRISDPWSPGRFNPPFTTMGSAATLVELVTDGLVAKDTTSLRLAERIEGRNPQIWRIKIRRHVRFHDNTILTADDVLNTFEIIRQKAPPGIFQNHFGSITNLAKLSDYEVEVRLSKPIGNFPHYLTFGILPKHHFPVATYDDESFLKHPVGTGPFRLVRYDRKGARFERFENYFWGKPKLEAVEVIRVSSKEQAWMSFLAGNVDLFFDYFTDAESISTLSSTFRLHRVNPPYGYLLALNMNTMPLQDRRVRLAIAYAVNRARLLTFMQYGMRAESEWVRPTSNMQIPEPLPFDPDRAVRLLKEAGWNIPPGEKIRRKGNTPLQMSLMYFKHDELSLRVARAIAGDLFDVGLKAVLKPGTITEVVSDLKAGKTAAAISFNPSSGGLDRLRGLFHSENRRYGGSNLSNLSDPRIDALLDQAFREVSMAKRMNLYSRVLRLVREEVPAVFLFWRYWVIPMDRCWRNVDFMAGNLLGSCWRWYCHED